MKQTSIILLIFVVLIKDGTCNERHKVHTIQQHKLQTPEDSTLPPPQFSSRIKRAVAPDDPSWLGSLPFARTCGKTSQTTFLIIGGKNVTKGEYPWLVALFHYEKRTTVYKCGASLVSDSYVITAAHCITNQVIVQLEFGKHDISQVYEPDAVTRTSRKIFTHAEYGGQAHGDVALISFDRIDFTRWIQPICLWANFDSKLRWGTVAGWGVQLDGFESEIPQESKILMVGLEMCRDSNAALAEIATDKTFCAGGQSSGPCHGDSGGGFYINHDNVWYLRGIVSRSIGTSASCNVNEYAVYADLAYSLDWMRPYLSNHDLQPHNATELGALPLPGACGRSSQPPKQFSGKTNVTLGEYPWMVAVYYYHKYSYLYGCGGSLISNTFVISAARCAKNQKQVYMYLGKHDTILFDPKELNYTNSKEAYIVRTSISIAIHPEYNDGKPHADIALIKIDHVEFTQKIKPICLWTNIDTGLHSGIVAGWGASVGEEYSNFDVPQQISVLMVRPDTCRRMHGRVEAIVTNQTFCGDSPDSAPCHGYGGSGFYVLQEDMWYLRGMVSTAIGSKTGCYVNEYAIYVDLAYYLEWIQSHVLT